MKKIIIPISFRSIYTKAEKFKQNIIFSPYYKKKMLIVFSRLYTQYIYTRYISPKTTPHLHLLSLFRKLAL